MRPDGGVPDRGVKPDKPGPTWTVLKPPTQSTIYGLWGMNEYEVYLVGGNSTIIRYSGGAKFTSAKLSVPVTFYGVTRKCSSEIVVVGYQAAVRVCDRGTLKCTLADPTSGDASQFHWISGWCSASGACYIGGWVGATGGVFKSASGKWTGLCGSLANRAVHGVWGISDNEVYLADSAGRVFKYNGAAACAQVSAGATVGSFTSLWASSKGVLAAGQVPGSGTTGKGAAVWLAGGKVNSLPISNYSTIRAVHGVSEKAMVLAGDNGTVLLYDGSKVTDLQAPAVSGKKPHLWSAWISPDGVVFVGGPGGVFMRHK